MARRKVGAGYEGEPQAVKRDRSRRRPCRPLGAGRGWCRGTHPIPSSPVVDGTSRGSAGPVGAHFGFQPARRCALHPRARAASARAYSPRTSALARSSGLCGPSAVSRRRPCRPSSRGEVGQGNVENLATSASTSSRPGSTVPVARGCFFTCGSPYWLSRSRSEATPGPPGELRRDLRALTASAHTCDLPASSRSSPSAPPHRARRARTPVPRALSSITLFLLLLGRLRRSGRPDLL